MKMKDQIIDLFYESTHKSIYQYTVVYEKYVDNYDDSMMYSSYAKYRYVQNVSLP